MFKVIKALLIGHLCVFKHLFKKPITLEYPEKKRTFNENFRGKPILEGCIGCGLCQKVCPSGAIEINKDENGRVTLFKIDLKKCIFCGNCSYYCAKGAIKMSKEYELASENKNDLELYYIGGAERD